MDCQIRLNLFAFADPDRNYFCCVPDQALGHLVVNQPLADRDDVSVSAVDLPNLGFGKSHRAKSLSYAHSFCWFLRNSY